MAPTQLPLFCGAVSTDCSGAAVGIFCGLAAGGNGLGIVVLTLLGFWLGCLCVAANSRADCAASSAACGFEGLAGVISSSKATFFFLGCVGVCC